MGSEIIFPQQPWPVSAPTHGRPGLQSWGWPPSSYPAQTPLYQTCRDHSQLWFQNSQPLSFGVNTRSPPNSPAYIQLRPSLLRSPGRMCLKPRFSLSPNVPPASHLPALATASPAAWMSSSGSHRESPTLLSRLGHPAPPRLLPPLAPGQTLHWSGGSQEARRLVMRLRHGGLFIAAETAEAPMAVLLPCPQPQADTE